MNCRDRFLAACGCRSVDRPPAWLMRQAGRALPEYRALRERHTFVDLVRTPELAAEVTLQPVRRFGFDAAILFSDILVVPEALGQPYQFREGGGIQMAYAIRSAAEGARLRWDAVAENLDYLPAALRLVRQQLGNSTAVLGFAGSPWTLANFMIEGGSSGSFNRAKAWWVEDPDGLTEFLARLTQAVAACLQVQIDAGADAVQIFDSLAGELEAGLYEQLSARWIKTVVAALPRPVPVIAFVRGPHWPALLEAGIRVISVDWTVSLAEVRRRVPARLAVQGNLDPSRLQPETNPGQVARAARELLVCMNGRPGYIFNLGHGLPPTASLENIAALMETIRQFEWQNSKSI